MTINVKSSPYFATDNGSTDDTSAPQAAINAGIGVDEVYIPGGQYKISQPLTISGPILIRGMGKLSSYIVLSNLNQDGIQINTGTGEDSVDLRDFGITSPAEGGQTSGSMIYVTAASGYENSSSTFTNLLLDGGFNGILFDRAELFTIDACHFYAVNQSGVTISNLTNTDAGDSTITNCVFANSSPTSGNYMILQYSSSGLRIINNKINNVKYGIVLDVQAAVPISDLLISGNSIENCSVAAVTAQKDPSYSGSFDNILICSNEIALTPSGIVLSGANPSFANVTVTGNLISLSSAGNTTGVLVNDITNFIVSGNTISSLGGANSTGILVESNSSDGVLGFNAYSNLMSNTINNSSTVASHR